MSLAAVSGLNCNFAVEWDVIKKQAPEFFRHPEKGGR
jgi:hypothetical protein